jgi:hypothetical protein
VIPHHWSECRPALLDTSGELGGSDPAARTLRAVPVVWARLGDDDRESFHRVCCLNSRVPADIAVMERMAADIKTEAGLQ